MTPSLTAIPTPPRAPSLRDDAAGLVTAVAATIAGTVLMPFVALAWVAVSPLLPFVLAIRAIAAGDLGGPPAARERRAAA